MVKFALLMSPSYRAVFYDILDLSEKRESCTIRDLFSVKIWKKLRLEMCVDKIPLKDEVENWLNTLNNEVSKINL